MNVSSMNPASMARSVLLLTLGFGMLHCTDLNAGELGLSIRLPHGQDVMRSGDEMVVVKFSNTGKEDVRILKSFRPFVVFFLFSIVAADGTPVNVRGGGKVSFREDSMKYLDLGCGEFFGLSVSLTDLLQIPLKTGVYSLSVTYSNQYGNGCFKGRIKSNVLQLRVKE